LLPALLLPGTFLSGLRFIIFGFAGSENAAGPSALFLQLFFSFYFCRKQNCAQTGNNGNAASFPLLLKHTFHVVPYPAAGSSFWYFPPTFSALFFNTPDCLTAVFAAGILLPFCKKEVGAKGLTHGFAYHDFFDISASNGNYYKTQTMNF